MRTLFQDVATRQNPEPKNQTLRIFFEENDRGRFAAAAAAEMAKTQILYPAFIRPHIVEIPGCSQTLAREIIQILKDPDADGTPRPIERWSMHDTPETIFFSPEQMEEAERDYTHAMKLCNLRQP